MYGTFLHKRAINNTRDRMLLAMAPTLTQRSVLHHTCYCAALSVPGIFGRKGACQPMLCCISLGDEGSEMVLTGATSGHLYVWEGRNCTRCIKAHTGAIMAMTRCAYLICFLEARMSCCSEGLFVVVCIARLTQRQHSTCPKGKG